MLRMNSWEKRLTFLLFWIKVSKLFMELIEKSELKQQY